MFRKIRTGAGLVCDNLTIASGFMRNKLRVATVDLERSYLKGVRRFTRGITFRLTCAFNLQCKMCRFVVNGEFHSDLKKSLLARELESDN